jgi:homoserine dehydrogenase
LPGLATRPSDARTIRVGLLGLGSVGSAVACALAGEARGAFLARGFAPTIAQALVRRTSRPRGEAPPVALTADADMFFSGAIDVVVEARGGASVSAALAPGETVC